MSAGVTVADVVRAIAEEFPAEWAEPWDAVGLLVGDPAAAVSGVYVSLDVTAEAITRAQAAGANVLATHHPAFLDPPSRLTPAAAGPVFAAAAANIALVAAHTNLDRAPAGASALPALLGLTPAAPLEESPLPLSSVTVYVPYDFALAVKGAMMSAGAGRVGLYEGCTFSVDGTGSFTPRADASPAVGVAGRSEDTPEMRLESVCPRSSVNSVIAAIRAVHPYEEPLVVTAEVGIGRSSARMGRVCELERPMPLAEFAAHMGERAGVVPRVRGERAAEVTRVAVATGSAGSLVGAALAAGAHALVAGEVRYHDAVAAAEAGLAVLELGHDASEWPLVPVLADAIRAHAGVPSAAVVVDGVKHGYWTP